jgi:hypothetical protein
VPASVDGNGNINAVEYFLLQLVASPGDFNHDGRVDASDYNLWRQTVGTNDPRADASGNGFVDAADYVVWRKYDGTSSGSYVLIDSYANLNAPESNGAWPLVFSAFLIALKSPRLRRECPVYL